MTDQQKAAYVFAQSVSALAALESMKAANKERESQGSALAYDDKAFFNLQQEFLIGHNEVMELFNEG